MELSKKVLQELKQKRMILSDSDSCMICLLIERIEHLEEENEQLKQTATFINRECAPRAIAPEILGPDEEDLYFGVVAMEMDEYECSESELVRHEKNGSKQSG